jgi:hypothetical protein
MAEPRAFVATSFEEDDIEPLERFKRAIEAAGFHPFVDVAGSPDNPPKKVREHILESDCVIVVAFKRDELKTKGWRSSSWIDNEAGMAWAYGKPILAFVEEGVSDLGILRTLGSYTHFRRANLEKAEETNKIHAALAALRDRLSTSAQVEQLEWIERVLTPAGRSLVNKLAGEGSLYPSEDEGRFYEVAESIVRSSDMVRFATKTPVLLLPEEVSTEVRKRYRDALMERLRIPTFEAHYMFSLPQTMAHLQSYSSRNSDEQEMAVATLGGVQQAIEAGTLELRSAASDDFVSCIIGKGEMAYLWKSPQEGRSIATIYEGRPLIVEQFVRFFDKVFASARHVRQGELDEWARIVRGERLEDAGPVP